MKGWLLMGCVLTALALQAQQSTATPANVKQATPVMKVDNTPAAHTTLPDNGNTSGNTETKTCCQQGMEQGKACCAGGMNEKDCKRKGKKASCNPHAGKKKD